MVDDFKFEVGKTYVMVHSHASYVNTPRTIVHVDQGGWGWHIHVGVDDRPSLVANNPKSSCGWKVYVPPRTKNLWLYWWVYNQFPNGPGAVGFTESDKDFQELLARQDMKILASKRVELVENMS